MLLIMRTATITIMRRTSQTLRMILIDGTSVKTLGQPQEEAHRGRQSGRNETNLIDFVDETCLT